MSEEQIEAQIKKIQARLERQKKIFDATIAAMRASTEKTDEIVRFLQQQRDMAPPRLSHIDTNEMMQEVADQVDTARNIDIAGVDWMRTEAGFHAAVNEPLGGLAAALSGGDEILFGKCIDAGSPTTSYGNAFENDVAEAIRCNPCDAIGTNPDTSTNLALIPEWTTLVHPNPREDDLVMYIERSYESGGLPYIARYCIWGQRLEPAIGRMIWHHTRAAMPAGWYEADGTTKDGVALNDERGRAWYSYDSTVTAFNAMDKTGGAVCHTHPDHDAHQHELCLASATVQSGTGCTVSVPGDCWTCCEPTPLSHTAAEGLGPYKTRTVIQRVN